MSDEHSNRVNQAVEMIRAQADCTVEEAFVMMHERATMSGATMEELIEGVLDHSVRFDRGSI